MRPPAAAPTLALSVTRNEMPMPPIQTENLARVMPDIANEARPALAGQLEWVGMSGIDVPIEIADGDGRTVRFGARDPRAGTGATCGCRARPGETG